MKRLSMVCLSALLLLGLSTYIYMQDVHGSKEEHVLLRSPEGGGQQLEGKTIVLDPGHGGHDPGSVGQQGTLEKDVTLQTVQAIKRELQRRTGAQVVVTREQDETVSLQQRIDVAEEKSADLYVSVHYDAFDTGEAEGMTTYYYDDSNWQLANTMHEHLKQSLNMRDRGVHVGDYMVLRDNSRPSILLELGYISNHDDEQRMKSQAFQEQAANAIVDGIIDVLR
ncbi:N-acetylmuramoyl-L-alanine amidase [Paenibacillus sp. KS1]|uniref:N-acetylmuramoyl-L-alanine amidase family protein n=1 Tax=Paenibacillus sp. KS1 TaxID=1849249 RepID=UPI00080662B0|nr:N-acetylmuramoyl-L-alanine amidase [Paenibacillus sp. KS1]OBY81464.1 N-acetylmuramoyl-L-alanine amidase [Paenibacillus sp. KS1]